MNVREINAFALPGGPMFINRGMIERAHTEGEVAGVMAHELSHVALRHGTAQATKASPYAMGQIAGAVLGAIVGGRTGSVIAQGTQFGLGTAFLRFSREYEHQADLLGSAHHGARRLRPARHGQRVQDDRKRERSRRTAVDERSPEPGQPLRATSTKKPRCCGSRTAVPRDARDFNSVQAHLRSLPPAPSTEQATRTSAGRTHRELGRHGGSAAVKRSTSIDRLTDYTEYNGRQSVSRQRAGQLAGTAGNNAVTFAPRGASGTVNGQNVFTHGVEIGVARNETHELRTATDELIQSLAQSNPRLSRPSSYERR